MTDLSKSRSVLHHSHDIERGPVFEHALDEGGRLRVLTLDRSDWEAFGCPEQITITIEPGDALERLLAEDTAYEAVRHVAGFPPPVNTRTSGVIG